MASFNTFDWRTVSFRPHQLTIERLTQYLLEQPERIAEAWHSALCNLEISEQTQIQAQKVCRAVDLYTWDRLRQKTPILDRLTESDYHYLYCQYKFGTHQGMLGKLALALLDEEGNVSEDLDGKIQNAIEHMIDFNKHQLRNYLLLRPLDFEVRMKIRDIDAMLKDWEKQSSWSYGYFRRSGKLEDSVQLVRVIEQDRSAYPLERMSVELSSFA